MALKEHLKEARNRLFKSAIAVVICTVLGFLIYEPVLEALSAPVVDINERVVRSAALNFDTAGSPFDLMVQISVFLVCLFAAMAAPGADAMSMFYLAVPMLLLFFVAIGLCLLNDKRRARRTAIREAEIAANADKASSLAEPLRALTQ
ncbi:Sec-independent protein secretion pathway component TatC [Arthrobacter sp. CAN_A214]|uniref:twin-arginine translocase subunit TatC n=1 Tax=Arthrobacter sp. CAN_A214 TaxID=2787720 RepID=UPI0018C954FC